MLIFSIKYNTGGYETGIFHYAMNNKCGTDTLTSPYMPRGNDTEKALFLKPEFTAIYAFSHDSDSDPCSDPDSNNLHDSLFGDDVNTGSNILLTGEIKVEVISEGDIFMTEKVKSNGDNNHICFI